MFGKSVLLIVAVGLSGAGLLALRQARIQAASELAAARLQIAGIERELQRVRAQIADRIAPAEVAAMIDRSQQLASVVGPRIEGPAEPFVPAWHGEIDETRYARHEPASENDEVHLPEWAERLPTDWSLVPAGDGAGR